MRGKFKLELYADLSEIENPVGVFLSLGDNFGRQVFEMKEKKHHWEFKAKKSKE